MKTKNNTLPKGYCVAVYEVEGGKWDIKVWRDGRLALSTSGTAFDREEDARVCGFRRAWDIHNGHELPTGGFMKKLTQVLLLFGIGANVPIPWLMSLPMWEIIMVVLGMGIGVTVITEWAYRPR